MKMVAGYNAGVSPKKIADDVVTHPPVDVGPSPDLVPVIQCCSNATEVPRVEDIRLYVDSVGLGISIKGGVDRPFIVARESANVGIFVVNVYEEGAAAKDGRMRLGDHVLSVNGESVENVKQKEFVRLVANAAKDGPIDIRVKHHGSLERRLLNAQKKIPLVREELQSAQVPPSVKGVNMLTGFAENHFEPLESSLDPYDSARHRDIEIEAVSAANFESNVESGTEPARTEVGECSDAKADANADHVDDNNNAVSPGNAVSDDAAAKSSDKGTEAEPPNVHPVHLPKKESSWMETRPKVTKSEEVTPAMSPGVSPSTTSNGWRFSYVRTACVTTGLSIGMVVAFYLSLKRR